VAAFILMEILIETTTPSTEQKEIARRKANSHFAVWEQRTALVKQLVAAESSANDAKTARLRALRLAKEMADKKAEAADAAAAPKRRAKKRIQTIKV
jgi:hypothetical protein